MTVIELIDKAKKKQGLDTDNKLAIAMNLARQHVSNWRTGKAAPEAHAAVLLARLVDMPPMVAIAVCELSREKDPRKRRDWFKVISDIKKG